MLIELNGMLQRADGKSLTEEDRDRFADDFLAFCVNRGLGYGGGIGLVDDEGNPATSGGGLAAVKILKEENPDER